MYTLEFGAEGLCGGAAALYFAALLLAPGGWFGTAPLAALKAAPALLLAAHAARGRACATRRRMGALGLLLASLADALLELETADNGLFVAGLAAFLASHLCYLVALPALPLWAQPPSLKGGLKGGGGAPVYFGATAPRPSALALAAECAPKEAFAAYGALLLCVLLPHIGEGFLRAAVVAYAAVLAAMGAVACGCARAADEAAGGRPEAASAARLGAWGSVLFVASDSLLAIDRFVAPLPMARWAVMTTYLAAQALLADSFALAPPR